MTRPEENMPPPSDDEAPAFGVGDDVTQPKRKRKGPKKATRSHLQNAALHYLERFASSSANLRRVLMRRVDRSARTHGTDAEEGAAWVDEIITRYQEVGLLDDGAFARARAASLFARGTPPKGIRYKLKGQGIGEPDIDAALEALADEMADDLNDPDINLSLEAARTFARKRRIGPFRRDPSKRSEMREKDLAALGRAGFDYETARTVVDSEETDEGA